MVDRYSNKMRVQWMIILAIIYVGVYMAQPVQIPKSPSPNNGYVFASEADVIPPDDIQKTDEWVGKYVDQYCNSHYCRSRMRGIMHCLLTKESEHTFMDADDHHGDGGQAGGILQYWPDTWTGFRKIMISRGLITEIGSRYNPEQAIETTVWAILDKREGNWGPVNRGECLSAKGAR